MKQNYKQLNSIYDPHCLNQIQQCLEKKAPIFTIKPQKGHQYERDPSLITILRNLHENYQSLLMEEKKSFLSHHKAHHNSKMHLEEMKEGQDKNSKTPLPPSSSNLTSASLSPANELASPKERSNHPSNVLEASTSIKIKLGNLDNIKKTVSENLNSVKKELSPPA